VVGFFFILLSLFLLPSLFFPPSFLVYVGWRRSGEIRIKLIAGKMSRCYICVELGYTTDIAGEYLEYSFIWKDGVCMSLFQSNCPKKDIFDVYIQYLFL